MSHFLATEDHPGGYRLEDILMSIRKDLISRALKIADDKRPEALQVLHNNVRIMGLLSDAIALADESSRILDKAFGPGKIELPRIGKI